jgi:hypothetical protein
MLGKIDDLLPLLNFQRLLQRRLQGGQGRG